MKYFLLIITFFLATSQPLFALTIAQSVKGKIVLQVESKGEAWYVHPSQLKRYYLGRPQDAYDAMRKLGYGISNKDLARIPMSLSHEPSIDTDGDGLMNTFEDALGTNISNPDSDGDGHSDYNEVQNGYDPLRTGKLPYDSSFAKLQAGKIFLQVERHGEAWYVNPVNFQRYYLGSANEAFAIMRKLGLGIATKDLNTISIGTLPGAATPTPTPVSTADNGDVTKRQYVSTTIKVGGVDYAIQYVRAPKATTKLMTLTGQNEDCFNNCTAKPLADYVKDVSGFAGIHGVYFCPPDYADCVNKKYSYEQPILNSVSGIVINAYKSRWHEGPMITYDASGEYKYFHRAGDGGWNLLTDFKTKFNADVQSAISNYPSLIENGTSVVMSEPTLSDNLTVRKSTRGFMGFNENSLYIGIAKNVNVQELASITQALGMDYAMNLDGGGSVALQYEGQYKAGPGRLLPNAIVLMEK